MELSQVSMRPAKVLKVVDQYGTIKVSAPGVFTDADDPDLMPPVYPLFSVSSNTFSTPVVGDNIWLLTVRGNAEELFYLRMVDHPHYNQDVSTINKEDEIECLLRKDTDNGWGELYFSTGEGWIVANGTCKAVIDNKGNINLIGSSINLGSASAKDPACKFNELKQTLNLICSAFSSLSSSLANVAPQAKAAVDAVLPSIQESISRIKSEKVYIER